MMRMIMMRINNINNIAQFNNYNKLRNKPYIDIMQYASYTSTVLVISLIRYDFPEWWHG